MCVRHRMCHCLNEPLPLPHRRKSYTPRTALGAKLKPVTKTTGNYWDKATWDVPGSFLPDEWYYRVLWGVLAVSLTIYLNTSLGAGPQA